MLGRLVIARSLQRSVMRMSTEVNKTFVLEYHYCPNILEKRAPFRDAHLKYANACVANNLVVVGGALIPADKDIVRGLIVLKAPDTETVRRFAENDPYVIEGLVTKYDINEWAVAIGGI
jgi:uncharacterized protein